jgi:hypothetical protein
MKIYLLIALALMYSSCVNDIKRNALECFVYDSITKKPIPDLQVIQKLDGKRVLVAKTSKVGYFKIDKLTELKLGMETHNLTNVYFLEKNGYVVDTIISYSSSNAVDRRDSIFMKLR